MAIYRFGAGDGAATFNCSVGVLADDWFDSQPFAMRLQKILSCSISDPWVFGRRGDPSSLRFGSQNALGRALGVSPRSINEIVLGRRSITPEMSLKLGKFFKQSPQFWFNIQTTCDFRRIMKQAKRITAKVKGDFTKLAA